MRREQVVELLRRALEPLAYVNAAWLGGADAFGRADELSDVDLQVDVDDGYVAATFGTVEAALQAASPITARLVMPMPTWHGHAQRFYRLRDTTEFTAVDLVVFERSDDVQVVLRELSFVADLDDLAAKLPRAGQLLHNLLRSRPWGPGAAGGGSW